MSNYLQPLKTIILALLLAVGISLAHAAWVGPTAAPPGENTPAPVNVGIADQVKEAGLGVDALSVFGSSYIQGNLGIGTPDPTAALDITGGLRIRSGIPAADKMLTSDDSGVASWEDRDKFRLSSCTGNGSGVKCTPNCGSGWVLISNINVSELNTYGARPSNQYWTGVGLCQKLR